MYTIWTKTLLNIDSENPQTNNRSNVAWNSFHYFLYFNFFIAVPHIPFVEAIFEILEIICLNRQYLLINAFKDFLAPFKDVG